MRSKTGSEIKPGNGAEPTFVLRKCQHDLWFCLGAPYILQSIYDFYQAKEAGLLYICSVFTALQHHSTGGLLTKIYGLVFEHLIVFYPELVTSWISCDCSLSISIQFQHIYCTASIFQKYLRCYCFIVHSSHLQKRKISL